MLVRIHLWVGVLFVLASLLAFVWALAGGRRPGGLPDRYFRLVRVIAGLLGLQVLSGFGLLASGHSMPTPMHWLYAVLLLIGVGAMEMLRPGGRLREYLQAEGTYDEFRTWWILTLVVALLGMRAIMTGLLGF
jgi:hypothetical protein